MGYPSTITMKNLLLLLSITSLFFSSTAQVVRLQEDFNLGTLPSGWVNSAVTGTQTWNFGINGSTTNAGNNNLDGTAMAYFDDDNLGSSNTNNRVSLTSPAFDNSSDSATTLEFDYNFREFSGPADEFYVEVYDGSIWNTVFSVTSNDCGNWLGACVGNFPHANIDISAYSNAACQIRFTYFDGNDWCWYVGIDNVEVNSEINNDLSIVELLRPTSSCNLSAAEQIQVVVKNNSPNIITQPFDVTIDVNSGAQALSETITSSINAGDSITYSFVGTVNLLAKGTYSIQVYSSFSLDTNYVNDTIIRTIDHINALTIPLSENFENAVPNWKIYGQNSSWQVGVPTGTNLNFAYTGTSAAVTNLSGNYNNSEVSYFETPCISSTQPNSTPVVSFFLHHYSEIGFDGMVAEISNDNGMTWQKINAGSISTNWYMNNSNWEGTSPGWIKVENYLDSNLVQSSFKIRFKMTSDGSGVREGFAIDDFEIKYQTATDLAVEAIKYPTLNPLICGIGNEFIQVQLKNYGNSTIDSTLVNYRVNNGPIITELLDSTILSSEIITYRFSTPYDFSTIGTYSLAAWVTTRNDQNALNDSILNYLVTNSNNTISIDTLPFIENFDGPQWTSTNIAPNWTRLPVATVSNYNWSFGNQTTPSLNTGPNADRSGNGNYLYTEATGANQGDTAVLMTPCIRIPANISPRMEFYTHGYGNTIPNLIVEVNSGSSWQNAAIFSVHSQTSGTSPWTKRTVNLNSYAGSSIKIRFKTVHRGGIDGDLAIDEINIFNPLTTSIAKAKTESTFTLYPNPNNGNFNLKATTEMVGKNYQIFDLKGSIIKEARIGNVQSQIELSNADKGIYFFKIVGTNEVKKLVVQ